MTKDTNQILIAILETQLAGAKRTREADAIAINAHIAFETQARDLFQQRRRHGRHPGDLPAAVGVIVPEINPFTLVSGAIVDLLTRHSEMFVAMGTDMFRGFATILIAWFGIKAALASTEGTRLPFGRFASLLLTIAFGFTMMTFYDRPIPGIGRSFTHLITDQA